MAKKASRRPAAKTPTAKRARSGTKASGGKKKARGKATKKTATKKATAKKKTAKKAAAKKKAAPKKTPAKKAAPKKSAKKAPKAEPANQDIAPEVEEAPPKTKKKSSRKRVSAEQMGELQREISVSEFFTKNRHLLGFDNASRALLTSVKEAVDNSLDACEEAGVLPDIIVKLEQTKDTRYRMTVEDNGPGIVKAQMLKVFGKLLYGSKFHRLRQSRGQQGIGISAAGMYGQLTTGKPVEVTSKTAANKPAYHYKLVIDTKTNEPRTEDSSVDESKHWVEKATGTSVSIEMEASYRPGKKSVDEYIQQVAFANPHARIEYWSPKRKPVVYPRVTEFLPPEAKEIKPHPYGVELGVMMRMLRGTKSRNLSGFLQSEFSRVSNTVAGEICDKAGVDSNTSVKELDRVLVEKVYRAISDTKIMSPPTNCLAPIGETAMLEGLKALLIQQYVAKEQAKLRRKEQDKKLPKVGDEKAAEKAEKLVTEALEKVEAIESHDDEKAEDPIEIDPDAPESDVRLINKAGVIKILDKPCFVTAVTRAPKVYRGNPFQVEAALAWGAHLEPDELASVYRFANRVPLLYQQGACAMTQAVARTNWKSYDVQQSRGALPLGPLIVMVNIASVWVPFTSEAKEAVAHYDEIITELKYALQEAGRRLSRYLKRRRRVAEDEKKKRYIESYIPHIGYALQDILGLQDTKRDKVIDELTGILERSRKM